MSDARSSPNDESDESTDERYDATEPEDDELSVEELEEAAGGTEGYEPPAPGDEC